MLAGASCWVLYVDVLVLEMGGELTSWGSGVKQRENIDAGKRPPSCLTMGMGAAHWRKL